MGMYVEADVWFVASEYDYSVGKSKMIVGRHAAFNRICAA